MSAHRTMTVVFLAGMGTSLRPDQAAAVQGGRISDFWAAGKLGPSLKAAGLVADFFVFSYRGFNPHSMHGFEPAPYTPTDTLNKHISTYVERLQHQLRAYAARHPSTDFHLVGHSEGGLIAFAYLAEMLRRGNTWSLPNHGALASVVTLDSPLGGIANNSSLRIHAVRAYLAVAHRWRTFTSFNDMLRLYQTAGGRYPLGANGSVNELIAPESDVSRLPNQAVAATARKMGTRVLTIGNGRDHYFAPGHGFRPFISTQWLSDAGAESGIFGRWVVLGEKRQTLTEMEINHGAVLGATSVHDAILAFLLGNDPDPLLPAPNAESMELWLNQENLRYSFDSAPEIHAST